jgi:hypothetical protein
MGRRIPTIPFSGGKPVPGYDPERRSDREGRGDALETSPEKKHVRLDVAVRRAARELEQAVEARIRERPNVAIAALGVAGGACTLAGVFLHKPLLRLALVGVGGFALFHWARSLPPPQPQSVKGMLP